MTIELNGAKLNVGQGADLNTYERGKIMNFTYKKLRGRIIEKFGSIGAFADAVGISRTQMSKKLQGKAGISQKEIIQWSEILDIEQAEYSDFYFA